MASEKCINKTEAFILAISITARLMEEALTSSTTAPTTTDNSTTIRLKLNKSSANMNHSI